MLPAAESCMKNYWRYVLFLFALLLLNCIAGKDDNEYNCNYDIKNIEISGYENADIIILYFDLKGRAQTLDFDFEMTGAGINLNNEQLTFFESNRIDCFEYTSVDYHMSDLENSDGTEIRLKDLEYKTVTLKFTFYYREWIDSYDYRVKKGNTMTRSYKFGKLTCDPAPEPDKAPSLKAEVVSEECKINFDIGNICSNCQIYFWSSIGARPASARSNAKRPAHTGSIAPTKPMMAPSSSKPDIAARTRSGSGVIRTGVPGADDADMGIEAILPAADPQTRIWDLEARCAERRAASTGHARPTARIRHAMRLNHRGLTHCHRRAASALRESGPALAMDQGTTIC